MGHEVSVHGARPSRGHREGRGARHTGPARPSRSILIHSQHPGRYTRQQLLKLGSSTSASPCLIKSRRPSGTLRPFSESRRSAIRARS